MAAMTVNSAVLLLLSFTAEQGKEAGSLASQPASFPLNFCQDWILSCNLIFRNSLKA